MNKVFVTLFHLGPTPPLNKFVSTNEPSREFIEEVITITLEEAGINDGSIYSHVDQVDNAKVYFYKVGSGSDLTVWVEEMDVFEF